MTVFLLQYLKLIIFLVLVFVIGLSRVRSEGTDRRRAALGHASGRRGR